MMNELKGLNLESTALIAIDLQNGVVTLQGEPYSTAEIVAKAAKLINAFREKEAFVALLRVTSKDGKDILNPVTDSPSQFRSGTPSKNPSEIVSEIGVTENDFFITKHQWGAFYGTDLDLQLRRRGIDTIVLCGIATGYGVDTTAREAYQHGYNQVFAIDAMTGLSLEEHDYVLKYIFPKIGRLRTVDEIIDSISNKEKSKEM
ncbi:isochorismatase family protein [Priestia megaterium]|uniref:isochorismatase family protein n=1 Tax=Priestia megaterium TaxID=1404 RepID=UPI0018FE6E02|nr:isochorismatase family protein [Priestia megaterium]MCF6799559.1 isochorismatase family protein [Bacillus sp. ET1]MDN3232754.1 isochorismatase family protein [Priestia megaterium]MDN4865373.1 isochorismatase family protein [Priestia megaterium]MED4184316.1 isochorismatase family protein [Priestia megaterium]